MKGFNVAIIGKSGVGKSSLLNYLYGDHIAKTGSGRAQTKEGFHEYKTTINDKEISFFDSYGLEGGKTEGWLSMFHRFLSKTKNNNDVSKWLHTVIFCISGEGGRIEPFEERVINELKKEKLNPIIVITKADSLSDQSFENEVYRRTQIKPIKAASVLKKKGIGRAVGIGAGSQSQFGEREVKQRIANHSIASFQERVKVVIEYKVKNIIQKKKQNIYLITLPKIKEKENFFGMISENDAKQIKREVESKLNYIENYCRDFSQNFIQDAKSFYETNLEVICKVNTNQNLQLTLPENSLGPVSLNSKSLVISILSGLFVGPIGSLVTGLGAMSNYFLGGINAEEFRTELKKVLR